MYNPPTYLNKAILEKILSEFKWPAPYIIGDDSCSPDGVEVSFPNCTLYFVEVFESEMRLYFSPDQTQTEYNIYLKDALYVLKEEAEKKAGFKEPNLTGYFEPQASIEKVKNGLRDICILVQAYMLSCIEGDFNWVSKCKEKLFQ